MTADAKVPSPNRSVMLRVLRTYAAPHWRGLTLALSCAAGNAAMAFALTHLVRVASDGMQVGRSAAAIAAVALTIAAVGIARGVFQAIQLRVGNRIGHHVVGDMQSDMIGALIRSDLARLRGVHSGQYVSSMLYDAGLIRDAATTNTVFWVQHALTLIALAGYMVWVDVGLALLVLLGVPVAVRLIRTFSRRTQRAVTGAMTETSALSTAIMESLDGVKIVKLESRENEQAARVDDVIRRRQHFLIKGSNAKAIAAPVTETLMTLIIAGIVAYASWRASTGNLTAGEFTSFLTALIFAGQSVRILANMQTIIAEASSAATRLFAALDVAPTITEAPDAAPLPEGPSHVRFEEVSFDYGHGAPTLEHVSFEVRRGETIALVGPSGGGKSTALNLIPRFYDVDGGAITIDGHDIRKVTFRSLRERIALVTQEPFLFDDTIRNNIVFGRPGASDAQIEAAARAAAAHEFIVELPNGYDTTVGEAGARLSGGQRQRIAIARAFLKDAPILLLDEATSALDTESEAQVQAALERLMAGRTTILIAHRLSTVRSADRIYVLDRGRIVETGTHAVLIAQGGLYSRLAQSQDLTVADAAV